MAAGDEVTMVTVHQGMALEGTSAANSGALAPSPNCHYHHYIQYIYIR
jgi:hypothetical protein